MSVKRYDLVSDMDGNCNLNEARMEHSDDGSYVSYEDYAALEARCAALAAENAGLKVANAEGCKWDGEQWVGISIQTPATDAFLAEVRAQGVEMMAAEADQLMDEFGDDSYKVMVTADLQRFANAFAAQIRKGVQS